MQKDLTSVERSDLLDLPKLIPYTKASLLRIPCRLKSDRRRKPRSLCHRKRRLVLERKPNTAETASSLSEPGSHGAATSLLDQARAFELELLPSMLSNITDSVSEGARTDNAGAADSAIPEARRQPSSLSLDDVDTVSLGGEQARSSRSTQADECVPAWVSSADCSVCGALKGAKVQLLCDHWYCHECLRTYIRNALQDSTVFPPKCCGVNLEIEHAQLVLAGDELHNYFVRDQVRNALPGVSILYCPQRLCGEVVPLFDHQDTQVTCLQCGLQICKLCSQEAHPNEPCFEDADTRQLRQQAKAEGCSECPKCRAVVSLVQGCYHITCALCAFEFCYLCQAQWKTCKCSVWNEQKLLGVMRGRT
eukprot:Gregarina_sp_Pseudo_9__298@NODE_1192_length_1796_cov_187_182129_g1118_i0_p1_GENE_NODE_1192_length_1796_cov_187_182129_g1118_i0NODE_1192_length_1796_cov_187_182129_g1118_i0_p1_ORF_typecomplete_len364_score73_95IBR/PF01485_21/8_2e02IBR/PF01485_21/9_5e08IBR/PF01485_21/3_4e07zfC3HC4/PF00097_25/0_0039zfC3HC4/PF00097_25/1_8e04zfRING_14/PF17978_1/0_0058zfRING_14/PF17978_1/31zfRING_14/PF17978_1/3_2e03zfC3HC4_4/PF15227_6/0_011zfC3HC4_4/PF15227_6/2_6e03zfC3HC4_4/PF15227_6/4_6e03_NODE_1192_length_1796_cov_